MSHVDLTVSQPRAAQAIHAQKLLEDNRGIGEESKTILNSFRNTFAHFVEPISRQRADLGLKFLLLKAEWEADTFLSSSITQICMHPAYQEIIGMGESAIPLILAEIQRVPGHWFWALRAISGVDPTSPEDRGNISRMTEAWLSWGREGGYLAE